MQHSPSREANRFSASQEIPRILWKVHYRVTEPATCPYPQPDQSSVVDSSSSIGSATLVGFDLLNYR